MCERVCVCAVYRSVDKMDDVFHILSIFVMFEAHTQTHSAIGIKLDICNGLEMQFVLCDMSIKLHTKKSYIIFEHLLRM